MTKIRPIQLTLLLFTSTAALAAGCSSGGPRKLTPEDMIGADPLPLALGATWSYQVTISQFDADAAKDVKREMTWTTSVVDAHPIHNVISYKLKGWPKELIGAFDAGPTGPVPGETTILRAGDTFLWAETPDGGVDGAKGWFTWPLVDGQEICPDPQVTYCWLVATGDDGYRLTYRTGPDEEVYLIQPGTGVAEYNYVHHGTTLEVHAVLTEYKEGKAGAMSPEPTAPAAPEPAPAAGE